MEVKLKDIKVANAVKVDVENTFFKNDNYEITLKDNFFILIRHRYRGNEAETTVNNMIFMHREPVLDASEEPKPEPKRKRVVENKV